MKKRFLVLVFYTVAVFGARPPGGLAFERDKEIKETLELRRRCVHAAKAAAYAVPSLAMHGFAMYATQKGIIESEHFQKTYNSCEYYNRKDGAIICFHLLAQGLYLCVTWPMWKEIVKHCDVACPQEEEEKSKSKHNAAEMLRGE